MLMEASGSFKTEVLYIRLNRMDLWLPLLVGLGASNRTTSSLVVARPKARETVGRGRMPLLGGVLVLDFGFGLAGHERMCGYIDSVRRTACIPKMMACERKGREGESERAQSAGRISGL